MDKFISKNKLSVITIIDDYERKILTLEQELVKNYKFLNEFMEITLSDTEALTINKFQRRALNLQSSIYDKVNVYKFEEPIKFKEL